MAIKETSRLFGLLRKIELNPEQVERLQNDFTTKSTRPDILKGRIKEDGSAIVRGHALSEDINYILDAAVEGDVFT